MVEHYVPSDAEVIRNADACLADPDFPLIAQAWAATAKRYAEAALHARNAEPPQ